MKKKLEIAIPALFSLCTMAAAITAPTSYSREHFESALRNAHLVALVRITHVDTITIAGEPLLRMQRVTHRVDKCYKGGVASGDSVLASRHAIGLDGGHASNFSVGLRSIVCFRDAERDGIHLDVSSYKFDIGSSGEIKPPPSGFGFTDYFAPYTGSAGLFGELIVNTVRKLELIQYSPVLPEMHDTVLLFTSIELINETTLVSAHISTNRDAKTLNMNLIFFPGPVVDDSPSNTIVDTVLPAGRLSAGIYTANRIETNYLTNQQSCLGPVTGSVIFKVYDGATGAGTKQVRTPGRGRPAFAAPAAGAGAYTVLGRTIIRERFPDFRLPCGMYFRMLSDRTGKAAGAVLISGGGREKESARP
jgi:hypothetical protein